MKKTALVLSLPLIATALPAFAHAGHDFGLLAGLTHPLTGIDHLLAMLAVGLWSGYAATRLWSGAAAFMAAMALGAGLGFAGVALPMVEGLILLSVLAFGLLVAFGRRFEGAVLAVIGLFALAHGHAHATEAVGGLVPYAGGMLVSTLGLHVAGILLARQLAGARLGLGLGIAGAGLWMMVA